MKNFTKNLMLSCLIFALLVPLILYADTAKEFAYLGLTVWFQDMIPSLLPFMILSSLLVKCNLDHLLAAPFSGIFGRLFSLSPACTYVIVMGFLCGFPMGARAAALEYEAGKISKEEAEFLLAFTNNIGPIYFFSFVFGRVYPERTKTGVPLLLPALCLLYGVPLLYGILLRHTVYRHLGNKKSLPERARHTSGIRFLQALDESVSNALSQTAMLGGYTILCNLLVMFPKLMLTKYPYLCTLFHNLFEVSGGLLSVRAAGYPALTAFAAAHLSLAFTGLSCHLQTIHIIQEPGLSVHKYMLHRIILCSMVALCLLVPLIWSKTPG